MHSRKTNEDQAADDTDRGGWTTALVGLRGGAQRTRRPPATDFISVHCLGWQDGSASSGCQSAHQTGGRFDRAIGLGLRRGSRTDGRAAKRHRGHADHRTGRRQREQASGAARQPDRREGSLTGKTMALPRREMHVGRPALPGRPDEAVWHSSVQGEER